MKKEEEKEKKKKEPEGKERGKSVWGKGHSERWLWEKEEDGGEWELKGWG